MTAGSLRKPTAAIEFALRSDSWHEIEHACFFVTSILFWWPVIQPWPSMARWPRWSIPLYLFIGMMANDVIGISCLLRSGSVLLVCLGFPALRNFAA